jgi:hypothetical protein
LYSNEPTAKVNQCKSIERQVDQTIIVEVPEEVAGLLQNLQWAETRGLWIVINADVGVDLDTISFKQEGSRGKSIRERLHL